MKKRNKLALAAVLLSGTVLLAGCTASFTTNANINRILFALEPGVSYYFDTETEAQNYIDNGLGLETPLKYLNNNKPEKINDNCWRVVEKTNDGKGFTKSSQLTSIISSVSTYIPSDEYFVELDNIVLAEVVKKANEEDKNNTIDLNNVTARDLNGYDNETVHVYGYFHKYGYVKFGDYDESLKEKATSWTNYDKYNNDLVDKIGLDKCPTSDFISAYKSTLNTIIANSKSTITTVSGEYGSYGENKETIYIEKTTWKEAWGKGGAVIEGLIVYPVAWLLDVFAQSFAKGNSAAFATGIPQLLSLLLVTVIVRLFIFLVTIKSTFDQQKMTALQPKLTEIQQKYPNANTNQAQKQRMAEEQMKLYKKYKVNPLSSIIVMIIQFPVFIGVWGAMTGSAVLATGSVLGLNLSDSIWNVIISGKDAWWVALVLFIFMAIAQFFSMKLPQWIQKARSKKVAKLGKNPAMTQQNKTMNMVSWVMLVMIIVMGASLPAAMGFYWFVGALVSLLQTLITQVIIKPKKI